MNSNDLDQKTKEREGNLWWNIFAGNNFSCFLWSILYLLPSFSFCHCTVASREQLVTHFSQLHSQDHLADVVREEVVHEVAGEEVVNEDLNHEVAREEIVEYDGACRGHESKEGMEVILIDQEIKNQGILVIEEPVVYC